MPQQLLNITDTIADIQYQVDLTALGLNTKSILITLQYDNRWYLSLSVDNVKVVDNIGLQKGIDAFSKIRYLRLGKFIPLGDTTSLDCFANYPVEVGYD